MKNWRSDDWSQEDIEKIFAAIEILEGYGLDTSGVRANVAEVLPHTLPIGDVQ